MYIVERIMGSKLQDEIWLVNTIQLVSCKLNFDWLLFTGWVWEVLSLEVCQEFTSLPSLEWIPSEV